MDTFTRAYVEAAEFTDVHSDNPELEAADGFSEPLQASFEADCAAFQEGHADLLEQAYAIPGYDESRAGHDFWLTRNRHGAGFWDRGLPGDLGRQLTDMAHAYGGVDLYAGDDNQIHGS